LLRYEPVKPRRILRLDEPGEARAASVADVQV
jgi:hypothetical protein